jgi:hypothetical protein
VQIIVMGRPDEAGAGTSEPDLRKGAHLRRTKLVSAFVVTALVGVGSYTATYDVLNAVTRPSPATGSIAPAPSGGHGAVPAPGTPAQLTR